jgi:predicted nucleotidyltransferase component of viral defense system
MRAGRTPAILLHIDISVNICDYRQVKSQVQRIESFHLSLLRMLEARLNRENWVVKGGVNLRAWFGSRRYSEDLDLDVIKCAQHVLRERFDKVSLSRPLAEVLTTQGLEITRISKPKQTDTTQRWKIELKAAGVSVPLHTRVEFSRRGTRDEEYALEPVRADIVRPYGLPAPTANHYTARSAMRQKIQALAGRSETQARDVWDLDHLIRTTNADPRPLPREVLAILPEAVERAVSLGYDMFKAQVVPYLSEEDQTVYGTRDAWDRMCELVAERLEEFQS